MPSEPAADAECVKSAYGAACFELALRKSLVLVSLDERLIAAARALGHPVLSASPGNAN